MKLTKQKRCANHKPNYNQTTRQTKMTYEHRNQAKGGEQMVDIMAGSFLTKSEGDDGKLAVVKFNNGTTKPMRHAKKFCLDEIDRWRKSLHRLPNPDDWPGVKRTRPQLFSLETIDELFGSFDNMIEALEKRKRPPRDYVSTVKVIKPKEAPKVESVQEETPKVENIQEEAPQPQIEEPQIEETPQPQIEITQIETPKPETLQSQPEAQKPDEERQKNMAGRKEQWTDIQLAKILREACGDKSFISVSDYSGWRSNTHKNAPSYTTIVKRLGGGKWEYVFPEMRRLLNLEEPKADKPPAPETEPETETPVKPKTELEAPEPEAPEPSEPEEPESAPEPAAQIEPSKPVLEERPDELCLQDVRYVAAKLAPGEYLSALKYNILRPSGTLTDEDLRDRFDCKWEEVLILADVPIVKDPMAPKTSNNNAPAPETAEPLEITPEPAIEPIEPKPEPEASEPSDSSDVLPFPSYRVVNLLSYDCQMQPYSEHTLKIPKSGLSVVFRTHKTLRVNSQGDIEENCEQELILEYSGREVIFPEPEEGVVYLVDSHFCDAMKEHRDDFIPVHHGGGSSWPGLHVGWLNQ